MTIFSQISSIATTTLVSFLNNTDWSRPSWDLFIILFFLISIFIYGVSLKRRNIFTILISIYVSLAVTTYFPLYIISPRFVSEEKLFLLKIFLFLIIFLILVLVLSRSLLFKTTNSTHLLKKWFKMITFSILQSGLMVSIVLSFLPLEFLERFTPHTRQIFVSGLGRFIWIVLPLVIIVFIGRRKSEEK